MDISWRNHSRIEVDTKLDSGKCLVEWYCKVNERILRKMRVKPLIFF